MRSRAFRPIAPILAVLLLTSGPVHAGPVAISEVIQVVGNHQNPPDLRLRSLTQTASTPISQVKGSAATSSPQSGGSVINSSGSLLDGVAVISNPQRGVEIIDQGDVEGTICDCGEILIPVGGFPKWPLLFLAAIPLFFIDTGDDIETPTFTATPPVIPQVTPTPTPPPQTPVPIPEPASLFLFGSGLAACAAGLRRRQLKVKLARVDAEKEE
jgi:PEP-CTERM motif